MLLSRKLSLISGLVCGSAFAPIFFVPGIFTLSILCAQINNAPSRSQAAIYGYLFGLGLYLSTIYWIALGVSIYDEFCWVIPFAILGLPAFMAMFYGVLGMFAWQFRQKILFHFIFCVLWIFIEWLISWVFTGLPWVLTGYTLCFGDVMQQAASIFGVLGLSFSVVYVGSCLYCKRMISIRIIVSLFIIISTVSYGIIKLHNNKTVFSELKARIVQPSITQYSKWDPKVFLNNLNNQIALSNQQGEPDIILWSEAALTVPYYYTPIYDKLKGVFTKKKQALLFGGVSDNQLIGEDHKIYSSLIALDSNRNVEFDYHKAHLVPFGEYMPFSKSLPMKKITPGIEDYSLGIRRVLGLESLNLKIHPLICYEAIFSYETLIKNTDADLIVNITNDAWYGNSSGPYQHFVISRMRTVETGLPMIRAGNNGISAIIGPLGRVIKELPLNYVGILDGFIPLKLSYTTVYSEYGYMTLFIWCIFILSLQFAIMFIYLRIIKLRKCL